MCFLSTAAQFVVFFVRSVGASVYPDGFKIFLLWLSMICIVFFMQLSLMMPAVEDFSELVASGEVIVYWARVSRGDWPLTLTGLRNLCPIAEWRVAPN